MKHEDFTLLPQPIDEDVSCKETDYDQCMYKVSTHIFFLNLIISTHRLIYLRSPPTLTLVYTTFSLKIFRDLVLPFSIVFCSVLL